MTKEEFAERIIKMMETLYRISYAQLSSSHDRDDAVGECLCKAWQKRRQLKNERYMQTWVVRILINECRNINKKNKRELPMEDIYVRTVPTDANPELHDALLRLDDTLRLPILLHYIEGFTIKEIAKILRIPQGTVKTRMLNGRRKLRDMLTEDEEGRTLAAGDSWDVRHMEANTRLQRVDGR